MKMATFGPVGFSDNEIQESVKKALDALGTPPKLAIIYPSINGDMKKIVELIKKETDATVVGASTGGAGFNEYGISQNGLVGGFLGGDPLDISAVKAKGFKADFDNAVKSALSSIKSSTAIGHSLFILADAFSCDGELLVKEVQKNVPIHWRMFGGLAGDNWKFEKSRVIFDDDVYDDGAVFVYINTGVTPSMSVRHGFTPMDTCPVMQITDIENNVLKKIDDKPVMEVYKQELMKNGILKEGEDPIPYFATYPIGVKTLVGEKLKIRTPLSIQDNNLVLAGSLSNKERIQIMVGKPENMIEATKEMAELAKQGLKGKKPEVQLVIDCAGRRVMLGDRYKDEVKAIRISQDCPMLGFASYGEIARYGGSLEGFHNTTCVTSVW